MKKSMLYAGLMTILSATTYAEDSGNLNSIPNNSIFANGVQLALQQETQQLAASNTAPIPVTTTGAKTPNSATMQAPTPAVQNPPTGTATQATGTPATPALDTSTTPSTANQTPASNTSTPAAEIKPPQPLNCSYRIPAETAHIEQTIIVKWAEKAAEQSFDYDFNNFDTKISELKTCYTEQGWQGFNDALEKSGNINAIKTQKLTVSSMVSGESKVTEIKDNQWKIIIPMQVVYQNDKEKLTQPLTVNLVVGRKVSGDLGIMQMIAIPSQPTTNSTTGSAQPASTP